MWVCVRLQSVGDFGGSAAVQGTPWSLAEANPAPFYPWLKEYHPCPCSLHLPGEGLFPLSDPWHHWVTIKNGKSLVRQWTFQTPNYSDLSHCCFLFYFPLKRLRTRRTQQSIQGWSARIHESSTEPAPLCQQHPPQQILMPDCSLGNNTQPQEELVSGVGFVLCWLGYFFLLD